MKKRLIFEVEESKAAVVDENVCAFLCKFQQFCKHRDGGTALCAKYNLSTLKFIGEYEEDTKV